MTKKETGDRSIDRGIESVGGLVRREGFVPDSVCTLAYTRGTKTSLFGSLADIVMVKTTFYGRRKLEASKGGGN